MAIEEVGYKVLEKQGNFELREYEPHVVAEILVEGEFESASNEGFRSLFNYISGNNRKKESIPMTAPVTQEARSEKIAMTSPVSQEKLGGGKWRITFLMPSKFNIGTLPEPLDPRVKLKEIPGRVLAALRYSGTWSKKRYDEKEAQLRVKILEHGLNPSGESIFARYNSPFTLWFLRRNEVLIPVQKN